METKEVTARHGANRLAAKQLIVAIPGVSRTVACTHLAITQPRGMVVRCRRGRNGGYLDVSYWRHNDALPIASYRWWDYYIVASEVKDDDDTRITQVWFDEATKLKGR